MPETCPPNSPYFLAELKVAHQKIIASPYPAGQGAGSELYVHELPVDEVLLGIELWPSLWRAAHHPRHAFFITIPAMFFWSRRKTDEPMSRRNVTTSTTKCSSLAAIGAKVQSSGPI